jgi:hypothetical protein
MSNSSRRRISLGTGAPLAALSTHFYRGINGIGIRQTTRRSLSFPGRGQPAPALHSEAVRFATSARRSSARRRAGMPLAHSGWRRRVAGTSLVSECARSSPRTPGSREPLPNMLTYDLFKPVSCSSGWSLTDHVVAYRIATVCEGSAAPDGELQAHAVLQPRFSNLGRFGPQSSTA